MDTTSSFTANVPNGGKMEPDYVYTDAPRQDILRMIPPDGKVIGSIGCGYAATEAILIGQGREVHGVDVSPIAITRAQERLTSARVVGPDDRAPFAPDSLDGLILADVIEHIPAAWKALELFAKAVRPGGWVAISVPNMRQTEVLVNFFWKGDWPENKMGIFDATHVQVLSPARLRRWIAAAGLVPQTWFDCYDPNGPRRYRFFRTCDLLTLKLLHSWFMYELQVLCRRQPSTMTNS